MEKYAKPYMLCFRVVKEPKSLIGYIKSYFERRRARKVACDILNDLYYGYQFSGKGRCEDINDPIAQVHTIYSDKHQLAYWVLRRAGYVCNIADLWSVSNSLQGYRSTVYSYSRKRMGT